MDISWFDINQKRIDDLRLCNDHTCEVLSDDLRLIQPFVSFTSSEDDLSQSDIFIITVPTPIDNDNKPDLLPLEKASDLVGRSLEPSKSSCFPLIIYESTVFPGATETVCVPILEDRSGLKFNSDFSVGYSPERINPGDKTKSVTSITKVTSGSNSLAANLVDSLYSIVITAGTYKAPSIMVAEAAKIIENIQRDVNIALVNELSIIFRILGIDTQDVLSAASTKWNFHRYSPGLVGGHCIGVDPYYLTYRAAQLGYTSRIVLAGRQLNDEMPKVIVKSILYESSKRRRILSGENILLLGFTFKENCPDIRNSKAVDLYSEFCELGCNVTIVDPCADIQLAKDEYDVCVERNIPLGVDYACVVAVVSHKQFTDLGPSVWIHLKSKGAYMVDIKGDIIPRDIVDYRV